MLEQRFDCLLSGKGAGCIVFLLLDLDDGAGQPFGLRFYACLILRPYIVNLLNNTRLQQGV